MRFPDWSHDRRQPQLGDVAYQVSGEDADDHDLVRRAYLVVGVIETRTGYRLVMERVAYGTLPASDDELALWTWWNVPRRPR